jgi:hypothetical protein
MSELGVVDLIAATRELQRNFELDSIRVSKRTDDGHVISLSFNEGMPLVIEREDGHVQLVDAP